MVKRLLVLLMVLAAAAPAGAQTLRGERLRVTNMAATPQTNCAYVDASGNFYSAACPAGDISGVSFTLPGIFSAVTPCTSGSCAFTFTLASQSANTGWFAPDGSAGAPTFRFAVPADFGASIGANLVLARSTGTGAASFQTLTKGMQLNSTVYTDQSNTWGAFLQSMGGGLTVSSGTTTTQALSSTTGTFSGALAANAGFTVDTTAFTVADTTGNVATAGTLTATGASALNGGITVDTTNFTVNGTTGAVSTASDLAVAGTSDLKGNISDSTGNLTLNDNVDVLDNLVLGSATGEYVRSGNYASRTTGWQIDYSGTADLREGFFDQMKVKLFTVEQTQAVNGSMTWTKSVAELAGETTVGGAVTCPTLGAAETYWFRDFPAAANIRAFQTNDYLSIRTLAWADSGADGAAELSVTDCIGIVTAYADGTAGNDGYQSWTFTRPAGANGGSMAGGTAIALKLPALNYGVTADGVLEATVNDGANNINAPYFGVKKWTTSPIAANFTNLARFGQLRGITSVDEYGIFAGPTFNLTNGQFFRASDTNFDVHGLDFSLWDADSANIIMRRNSGNPYLAIGNAAPTAYATGGGIWMGSDSGTYKFRVGDLSSTDYIAYNGSTFTVRGDLNADDITAGTITGRTVQTAASGARVVMDTAPSLKWYDASALLGSLSPTGAKVVPYLGAPPTFVSSLSMANGYSFDVSALSSFAAGDAAGLFQFASSSGSTARITNLVAVSTGTSNSETMTVGVVTNKDVGGGEKLAYANFSSSAGSTNVGLLAWNATSSVITLNATNNTAVLNNTSFAVDTSTLFVDSSANEVGVGTTTPSAKFTVEAGDIVIDPDKKIYLHGDAAGSLDTNWYLYKDNTNHHVRVGGAGSGSRSFLVEDTSASNAQRFAVNFASGLTTITVPSSSTVSQGMYLLNPYATTNVWTGTYLSFGYSAGENYSARIYGQHNANASYASRLYFQTHATGTGTWNTATYINENGDFLAGKGFVVTGAATLGTSATAGTFSAEASSTFRQYTGDGTGWKWAIAQRASSTTTDLVWITDNDDNLNVVQNVYAAGFRIAATAAVGTTVPCLGGTTNAFIGTCTSSRRYKQDIAPFGGSRAILRVQPMLFHLKTQPTGAKELGAIAEDVHALGLRHLVRYDEHGRPDGLNYDKMALYLIPIIKEQQQQIDALTARLAALEARIK